MNDTGGSSAVGQRIPLPTVRVEAFEWARKPWANQPTVWPQTPPRVPSLTVMTHILFVLMLAVAALGAGVFLVEYVSVSATDANRQLVLGAIAAELILAAVALVLARFGIAVGAARFFFLFFVVSSSLAVIGSAIVIFMTRDVAFESWAIPQLANLPLLIVGAVFIVLSIVLWASVSRQVSGFVHWRGNVLTALQTVFPNGQRERLFVGEPLMLDEHSGELERRLAVAERLTAPVLEQLLRMPGVTIVQGIEVPGSRTTHVGHAVVAGNQIAFIDSLLWAPGEYVLDAYGCVVRDGKIDEHINVTTAIAAQRLTADRPQLNARCWAVVHRLADAPLTVATNPKNQVRLVAPEDLLREVGEWLAPVGEQVDAYVLQFAVNSRIK